jgi:ADP-dependent NAD(P)H-hydrate dehydratase / NAD(P)H-hydrate epimerase
MKIISCAEMRVWEQETLQAGMSVEFLMERAVAGLLKAWQARFPKPGQALFLCGKGHNGNDGLWLAEALRRIGWKVEIVLSHAPAQRKAIPSAAIQNSLHRASIWPTLPSFNDNADMSGRIHILVDAMLGNGASGSPHGVYAEILGTLDQLPLRIDYRISLDSPSGLDPDTGKATGHAFRSDLTLCLGAIKPGLLRDQARPWVGRLELIPLPLNKNHLHSSGSDYFGLNEAHALAKPLPATLHKYQRGTLSLWAGSPGMEGAALLSCGSSLRAGAGVVRLHTHPTLIPSILQCLPEIMTCAFPPHPLSGSDLPSSLLKAKAWVLGPGVGITQENHQLLKTLLSVAPGPVVLDADALTLLAQDTGLLDICSQPVILTPHQGELERLLQHAFSERSEAAKEWLKRHPGSILVAKGPNTLIQTQGKPASHNASGNPGMASAGMGDVLSGVIGSLLAQGS